MADEGNESRLGRMDLNLYLGLPRSPRPRSSDLGSDLSLGSLPLSTSSTTRESWATLEMSSALEPTDSHAPYSPSHASFTTEPSIPLVNPVAPTDGNANQEYTPYSPYEPYASIPVMMPESEEPDTSESPPSTTHPLPTLQEAEEPPMSPPGHWEPNVPYPASYTPSYVPLSPSYIPLDPQEMNDDPLSVSPLRTVSPLIRPYVPPFVSDVSMYDPPMPSYVPRSPPASPPWIMYSPRSPSYAPPQGAEPLGRDDASSSRRDLFESPEYRFRRLIESSRRLQLRRFRSSLPYHGGSERSNFVRSVSPVPEQQSMHDIMSSQRSLETNGKHKVAAGGITVESSEDENEEKSQTAANFECNVCLDMAQEPVVTSCGHLFCWPCLYQWLHVHSEHRECPVCKGEVIESNITPIYGRGNSEASDGKKLAESRESNIKIPPRPRGNRFESLRQQFRPIFRRFGEGITTSWFDSLRQQFRPISRRFGEGITTSWRRLVNQQMHNRNRVEGHGDPIMPTMLNGEDDRLAWLRMLNGEDDRLTRPRMLNGEGDRLTRLRARRRLREELNAVIGHEAEDNSLPTMLPGMLNGENDVLTRLRAGRRLREELNAEIGYEAEDISLPSDNTSIPQSSNMDPLFRDGIDLQRWPRGSTTIPRSSDLSPLLCNGIDFRHWPTDSTTIPQSNDIHPLLHDGIGPGHRPRDSATILRSSDTDPVFPDRAELWHRFNVYGLYATADIERVVGNGNRYRASTSSVNPPSPERVIPRANVASASAADQVSASSTIAVIQGDVGLPEGSAEPNSAGSSRSYYRRGRTSTSGSLDVDGRDLHARKRRRQN